VPRESLRILSRRATGDVLDTATSNRTASGQRQDAEAAQRGREGTVARAKRRRVRTTRTRWNRETKIKSEDVRSDLRINDQALVQTTRPWQMMKARRGGVCERQRCGLCRESGTLWKQRLDLCNGTSRSSLGARIGRNDVLREPPATCWRRRLRPVFCMLGPGWGGQAQVRCSLAVLVLWTWLQPNTATVCNTARSQQRPL